MAAAALTPLGLQAATALPGRRMQAWDIALTDRGPVRRLQPAPAGLGRGLMDERFHAFLASCTAPAR
jgi:hypothetical protein